MLRTEERNLKTMHIDKMSSLEIAKIMNEENRNTVDAVEAVLDSVSKGIDAIAEAFAKGGRLFYIGAGTSGRLGVADAAECPPTFGVPQEQVIGIIAGGYDSLVRASELSEDSGEAGVRDVQAYAICENDVLVGISAAGGAAYVVEALKYAKSVGCTTIGVTSNAGSLVDKVSDISICPDTGAEVVTGSTRLKAGTSQKLILNMLSTGAMIKSGYVYENLMINLRATNIKLKKRMINIVCDVTKVSDAEAERYLECADWNVRKAIELVEGKREIV